MKLRELIVKLRDIEKTSPEADVAFSRADIHDQISRTLHLLDVGGEGGGCQIVLGDYEGEERAYKEWREALRKRRR
jgi:hypothetical protein